jgi:chromosome segregation protein
MKLKSLSLNGFKTFASRTDFEFAEEVTVIVGPNGSGKSNIADAVRWVLGEQSYKLLRGRKTLDMIFSGSDERPRAGMAAATITFDNSDGWLPIDFSEVTITRRAYRDGKNEYLINGQQVLLRDVYELLGQSGLAERTYTIIGQGLVDAVLSLKAEERRQLFEEAAGIGLYRSRRIDAEKRLEKTHRNLDRVMDILSELKPRVKSLERQAGRAEQYQQVKKDLRMLLQEWYGYHWARVQQELGDARLEEETQRKALERARQQQTEYDRKLSESQVQIQSLRSKLNSWHRELSRHHSTKEQITRERAISDERIRALEKRVQEIDTELVRLREQETALHSRVDQVQKTLNQVEQRYLEARGQAEQIRGSYQAYRDQRSELEDTLREERQLLEQLRNKKLSYQVRVEDRREQIQKTAVRLSELEEQIEKARQQAAQEDQQTREAELALKRAVESSRKIADQLRQQQEKISAGESYRQDLEQKIASAENEISRLRAEREVLQQAESKLVGYASGARLLLKEAQSGRLPGVLGALSSALEVPEEYEKAVAAALGEYLDAVILDREGVSERALEMLLQETTRGVLLPLERLAPPEQVQLEEGVEGLIGLASDLVTAPPRMRPVVDLLLGRVILIKDKRDITRVLRDQPPGTKAVTLQGEVYHATGEIEAGSQGRATTLSRSRQKKTFHKKIAALTDSVKEMTAQLAQVQTSLEALSDQQAALEDRLAEAEGDQEQAEDGYQQAVLRRDAARQQLVWEQSRYRTVEGEADAGEKEIADLLGGIQTVEQKIIQGEERIAEKAARLQEISLDEEREQLAFWEKELAVAERGLKDVRERMEERETAWREAQADLERLHSQKEEMNQELAGLRKNKHILDDKELQSQQEINELRGLIDRTDQSLEEAETAQGELQKREAAARKTLNRAERLYAQAEINLTRSREKLESMQEKIKEDIGLVELEYQDDVSGPTPLPLEGYVQKLPEVEVIPKNLGETIREKRGQLRRLGAINPEARDEYREVSERYQFMTEQLSDLRKAEADIKEVIAELEVIMEREFRTTFDQVAAQFREIFTRLFGGGKGQLVLTEPDDLNISGVEIDVKLPGRRTQGLSLLSGGERSLVAAALIFALLKISPTPFCVLDEVDAMLDESNVARYRKLLRELSDETQFIVITHNRNTVQVADVIYGVIMSDDSSSQVLSLKLDEVDEVIDS